MKKRVAIARAIALNPRFLLCDEPNSGLDPETGIVIDNLIKELTEEFNMTTIVNSHDMNSVLEIGDHVLYIHKGCLCWEGTRDEVMHTENEALNNFVFATNMAKQIKNR
jgi:phospholipid/cholesterol/gamma-HCH transport system ATP-binding protein